VLIAVSRSAHDSAVREVAAQKAAQSHGGDEASREKIEQLNQYVARLDNVRNEAQQRLHDDRLRLSHIEDHMRRLSEELARLQQSVVELVAVEGEHIDDHKQGEQEVERLSRLIASTNEAIAAIKEEKKSRKRSYAIIPYEGPHGTQRRPIYIECRKDEVLLQPEGIRLTPQDFRPPLGASNPLAAALRAAREYIVRADGTLGKESEPYPLILVRPEGILAYYRVRDAIESWDAAFGYELIENDWSLDFPASNPVLAQIEQQAIEQSRSRQQMLVAAAPRAYGSQRSAIAEGFESDEDFVAGGTSGGSGFGDSEQGKPPGGPGAYAGTGKAGAESPRGPYPVGIVENSSSGEFFAAGVAQTSGGGGAGRRGEPGAPITEGTVGVPGAGTSPDGDSASVDTSSGQLASGSAGGRTGNTAGAPASPVPVGQEPGNPTSVIAGSGESGGSPLGAVPQLTPGMTGSSLAGGVGEASLTAGNRLEGAPAAGRSAGTTGEHSGESPSLAMQMNKPRFTPPSARGQNWAIRGKAPSSVPIRRTIRVVVRGDRLSIQPDSTRPAENVTGHEISLQGPTLVSLDEFVAAIQERVHEWGIAGNGLYWRPVLELDVGPDGQARADDLARLLRNSGIELKSEATASRPREGQSSETR
jgi:hypothetical protein